MGYSQGESHTHAKLTVPQVLEIFYSREKYQWLALEYHVSTATISYIKNKKVWTHLLKDLKDPPMKVNKGLKRNILTQARNAGTDPYRPSQAFAGTVVYLVQGGLLARRPAGGFELTEAGLLALKTLVKRKD